MPNLSQPSSENGPTNDDVEVRRRSLVAEEVIGRIEAMTPKQRRERLARLRHELALMAIGRLPARYR